MAKGTALDPRFKNLKCLLIPGREEVWQKLREILKVREPASSPSGEGTDSEPPKRKLAQLLTESESDNETTSSQNSRQVQGRVQCQHYGMSTTVVGDTHTCPWKDGPFCSMLPRYTWLNSAMRAGHIMLRKTSTLSKCQQACLPEQLVKSRVDFMNWLTDIMSLKLTLKVCYSECVKSDCSLCSPRARQESVF